MIEGANQLNEVDSCVTKELHSYPRFKTKKKKKNVFKNSAWTNAFNLVKTEDINDTHLIKYALGAPKLSFK